MEAFFFFDNTHAHVFDIQLFEIIILLVASSLVMDLSFDESNSPRVAAKSH